MQPKMFYANAFVLVCLCITQPACWAGSKPQKKLITKLGTPGKEVRQKMWLLWLLRDAVLLILYHLLFCRL